MTIPLRITALLSETIAAIPPDARDWERRMEQAIARGHTAAWIAGTAERLGVRADSALISRSRLSRAERADIAALVKRQMDYLKGFAGAREGMSEAAIRARAQLYAGAVRASYYTARWGDWEIPDSLMPGMQTCLGNCKCRLSDVKDNGDGTGVLTREMGSEPHCKECPPLQGDHPVRRKGAAIKQTAQDRAMFANMGSSGGGGGAGGKPTGGQGGLWKVNPETGKREESQGLAKGAKPAAGDVKPTDNEKPNAQRARETVRAAEQGKVFESMLGDDEGAATYEARQAYARMTFESNGTPGTLPINNLIAETNTFDADRVTSFMGQPIRSEDAPSVLRYDGKNYLMDGHHRALSRAALGENDVSVRIYDVSHVKNDLPVQRRVR